MNNIKVSVIVPVYNCEKYLKKCLDSLVNQTLKDIEIICVNDGSTDNSGRILEEYTDSRIKIITKENGGISSARNAGIAVAKGEYLGFVDSDDWVDLDFYEKLYNTAVKYNADIAAAGIIRLHKLRKRYYLQFKDEQVTDDFKTKLQLCDIPDKSYVWNKIYKTDKFNKTNLKFKEGRIYEDVIFTPQILYSMKTLVTVPGTYYYYWRRPKSLITLKHETAKSDLQLSLDEAAEFLEQHNIVVLDMKTQTQRVQIFGTTVFKIYTKKIEKTYCLFNILRWHKKS